MIGGFVTDVNGVRHAADFLVDTGADRTVLSYDVLSLLELDAAPAEDYHLEGVGGSAHAVVVDTLLCLVRENGQAVRFRGPYAAFTDPAALDMCVLGRDVLGHFAAIIDQPGNVVCLLAGHHGYTIQAV